MSTLPTTTTIRTRCPTHTFALVVNCRHTLTTVCHDGSTVTTVNSVTVRECASLNPFPEVLAGPGGRQCRDYAGTLPPHTPAFWRYLTTDGQWALVRDSRDRSPGRPNWLFIQRPWLPAGPCDHHPCVAPG
jgi:hypothetical protein